MKKISAVILILMLLNIFRFGHGSFPASAHEEMESDSAIHEMPVSDNCSLIVMQIRQLVYSLKQNTKEMSSLQLPVAATSEKTENRQMQPVNEQRLKFLQDRTASLRHQIDMKELQLESCNQKPDISHGR